MRRRSVRRMRNPMPKTEFCVYCKEDAIDCALVPWHVKCPVHDDETAHVITVMRPVCLRHHPFPEDVRADEEYREFERKERAKEEAMECLRDAPFRAANEGTAFNLLFEMVVTRFGKDAAQAALNELRESIAERDKVNDEH